MANKPKRRWFRFRLSTVLILTAIAAWAMASRPWMVEYEEWAYGSMSDPPPPGFENAIGTSRGPGGVRWFQIVERPNPNLLWPALTLAAFLAWKALWAVVERRRHKLAATE